MNEVRVVASIPVAMASGGGKQESQDYDLVGVMMMMVLVLLMWVMGWLSPVISSMVVLVHFPVVSTVHSILHSAPTLASTGCRRHPLMRNIASRKNKGKDCTVAGLGAATTNIGKAAMAARTVMGKIMMNTEGVWVVRRGGG